MAARDSRISGSLKVSRSVLSGRIRPAPSSTFHQSSYRKQETRQPYWFQVKMVGKPEVGADYSRQVGIGTPAWNEDSGMG